MDWIIEHWTLLFEPAVVAAFVSSIIALSSSVINTRAAKAIHREKLDFDRNLAAEKLKFDETLAEKKVSAEIALAEKKFQLEIAMADRKRRQDLAENVLADFYEIQEIIYYARHPGSTFSEEGNTRPEKKQDETPDATKDLNRYYIVTERLKRKEEFLSELLSKKYRFVAYFGANAAKPYNDLIDIISDIKLAVVMLIENHKLLTTMAQEPTYKESIATIFLSPNDKISKRLGVVVETVESICRPAIQESTK